MLRYCLPLCRPVLLKSEPWTSPSFSEESSSALRDAGGWLRRECSRSTRTDSPTATLHWCRFHRNQRALQERGRSGILGITSRYAIKIRIVSSTVSTMK